MNAESLLIALFCAAGFVSWPIVGHYSKASGTWVGTVVLVVTAAMVMLLSARQLGDSELPTPKALVLLAVAGAINGVACYLFASKTSDPTMHASVFVVMVSVGMVICAPLFDAVLNGVVPTARHLAGFCLAVITIYLLNK